MADKQNPGGEIGATGLRLATGGTVEEEYHPNLIGRQALRVFREMDLNDPVVGAILYSINMLVRQVDWMAEQGDASEDDVDFLESAMEDMEHSFADFISEVLSMLVYGWSYHEIVYKRRDGRGNKKHPSKHDDKKIGWAKLPIRAQDTLQEWKFNQTTGKIEGFVQLSPPLYKNVTIPTNKALLFRTTSYKNNPEGRSLLRNAYRPWYFKNRIETIEGTGIERDLAGFPVIGVPAAFLADDASDDKKAIVAAFQAVGSNLRRDKQEYVIMPKAYDEFGNDMFTLELMSAGGARAFDTTAIIGRYDQRIAMTVLADFILLGHEKVGSFALSSDKTDIFAVALGTILDSIEETMNRFAIPRLWEINGWDPAKAPRLRHGDIEDRDLSGLGQFLQNLTSMGMTLFPDEDLDKYLRKTAHLPERSEETLELQEAAKEEAMLMQQQQGEPGEEGQENDFEEDKDGAISFTDSGSSAGPAKPKAGKPGKPGDGGPGQPTATPSQ